MDKILTKTITWSFVGYILQAVRKKEVYQVVIRPESIGENEKSFNFK